MKVVEAVRGEIKTMAKAAPGIDKSTLAAAALALASAVDKPDSTTSQAMCVKELRETMERLRELAPQAKEASPLDQLRARREARIARVSASES